MQLKVVRQRHTPSTPLRRPRRSAAAASRLAKMHGGAAGDGLGGWAGGYGGQAPEREARVFTDESGGRAGDLREVQQGRDLGGGDPVGP